MTITELHSNEELRRHEFPVTREKAFLAHAGVCPLPRRVVEAMADYARLGGLDDQEEAFPAARIQRARQTAARLLNAQMDEVAFVGPTSLGLSCVANGLPLRKGDNILIYQDDYPSNVYPWMALAGKGVHVRLMNLRELGRIRTIDVTGQTDENTRLVALASCHFIAGWRIDLAQMAARPLRRRGPLRAQSVSGNTAPDDPGVAQRPVPKLRRAGSIGPSPRRATLRSRLGEPGRPGRPAGGDGTGPGSGH